MISYNSFNFGVPLFFIIIFGGLWILLTMKRKSKQHLTDEEAFWEREREADSTRRKDITYLNYVDVPDFTRIDTGSIEDLTDPDTATPLAPEIRECYDLLDTLRNSKIVNFGGMTNTDLKLEYGAPNLPILQQYDANYINLLGTVARLGEYLIKAGFETEAAEILEYGISIGTDISKNYYLLANIYKKTGRKDEISNLIAAAQKTDSLMTPTIIKKLEELSR